MTVDSVRSDVTWRLATLLLSAVTALAQQVASAEKLGPVMSTLDAGQTRNSLPCTVEFTKPTLNLSFRFQSGYSVRVALDAYVGTEHRWRIVFRVTPVGGQPVYFVDTVDLPPPAERGFDAVNTGLFFTGEGRYDVQWAMWDDLNRVCRLDWSFDAHRSRSERDLKVAMPPGTAGDLSWHLASPGEDAAARSRRITILMNAALPITRQAQPAKGEWTTLLTILSSLLEGLPGANIRLVVFNLDQQRELFTKDGFTAADLSGIAHTGDASGRWKVDSGVLQNPSGGWHLIESLENREAHATPRPDTIVFLGLPATSKETMPLSMPQPGSSQTPRFAYLVYQPTAAGANQPTIAEGGSRGGGFGGGGGRGSYLPQRVTTEPADPIEETVQRMKGKTMVISSPDALSKAIADLRRLR